MQKDSVKYCFAHGYSLVIYSPQFKHAAHLKSQWQIIKVFKPLKKQRQILTFKMLEFKRQRCNNQTVAPRHTQTGGTK
jgi:hypothetical protein